MLSNHLLISIKYLKILILNQLETRIPITNQTLYIPFLTNLEDAIIFKGVEFITPKIIILGFIKVCPKYMSKNLKLGFNLRHRNK
jgi:hypothetical protein